MLYAPLAKFAQSSAFYLSMCFLCCIDSRATDCAFEQLVFVLYFLWRSHSDNTCCVATIELLICAGCCADASGSLVAALSVAYFNAAKATLRRQLLIVCA